MDWTVRGQVLEIAGDHLLVHLSGMMDDILEDWIAVPTTMPQWAKAANEPVFRASADIDDATELMFEYLRQNPDFLKNFTCRPIPKTTDYLFD